MQTKKVVLLNRPVGALKETDLDVIDATLAPLEAGEVMIARANAHIRYPSRFMLVAAANPCKCGYLADAARAMHEGVVEAAVVGLVGIFVAEVPLAEAAGRVPGHPQYLSDGCGLGRDRGVVAGVRVRYLGDATHVHRMMVAAGQQRLACPKRPASAPPARVGKYDDS